jgi:hypothetical protein
VFFDVRATNSRRVGECVYIKKGGISGILKDIGGI